MRQTVLASILLLALLGCGNQGTPAGGSVTGGDEPTTAAALAWVAAEHTGKPGSAVAEDDLAEELGKGALGTELRYRSDGEYDGDMLVVAVGTKTPDEVSCPADTQSGGGCVSTKQGTVIWEKVAPEEDPGNVGVAVVKDGTTVLVFQSGPDITGDPRTLDLPISVDDMFAIALDPRVDLTTSKEAVDAGAALTYWKD